MITSSYSVQAIQTEIFKPGEDLADFIIRNLGTSTLVEGDLLAVTSKIVSLAENRLIDCSTIDKTSLVKREADLYVAEIGYGCHLTVKDGLLIPSAGIDESNADGNFYILYPENTFESAHKLWEKLRQHYQIEQLGILITDSHTSPLRKGVTGISLAHWGIKGVTNLIGEEDLFGRKLKMTTVNVADALSVAAVFAMGEAAERMPIAIIKGAKVEYTTTTASDECSMPLAEDLYGPLLMPHIKGN
jgi:F420-0:gamma-glutamyl ligase